MKYKNGKLVKVGDWIEIYSSRNLKSQHTIGKYSGSFLKFGFHFVDTLTGRQIFDCDDHDIKIRKLTKAEVILLHFQK